MGTCKTLRHARVQELGKGRRCAFVRDNHCWGGVWCCGGLFTRIRLPRDWRCMASFCLAMFCAYSSCRWMFIIGKHNSWMAHPSGLWPTNSSNCGTQANMFPREALGAVIEFLREHSGEAPHDFLLQSMSQSHAELALLRQLPPLFYHIGKSSTRDS